MASKVEKEPEESEVEQLEMYLLGRFLDLGFPPSMADALVRAKVDWREAEKVLCAGPPGGTIWTFQYLMP